MKGNEIGLHSGSEMSSRFIVRNEMRDGIERSLSKEFYSADLVKPFDIRTLLLYPEALVELRECRSQPIK